MKKFVLPLVFLGLVSCSQDTIDPNETNSENYPYSPKSITVEFKPVEFYELENIEISERSLKDQERVETLNVEFKEDIKFTPIDITVN